MHVYKKNTIVCFGKNGWMQITETPGGVLVNSGISINHNPKYYIFAPTSVSKMPITMVLTSYRFFVVIALSPS